MKLGYLLLIISIYFIIQGVWRLYTLKAYKKAYILFKNPNEKYLDFLNRELGLWYIKLAVFLKLHWLYNSKMYEIIQSFIGILQVVLGVAIIIAMFFISRTEFVAYFNVKL